MELKSAGNIYQDVRIDSSNRTFMELKYHEIIMDLKNIGF